MIAPPISRKYVERPMVYLAGPYTHPDPVLNTHETLRLASELAEDYDVTPVVPHMSLLWQLVDPHPVEFWYAYDLALLDRCDALLRLEGESSGADMEVVFARERGILVFHDILDLDEWVKARKAEYRGL